MCDLNEAIEEALAYVRTVDLIHTNPSQGTEEANALRNATNNTINQMFAITQIKGVHRIWPFGKYLNFMKFFQRARYNIGGLGSQVPTIGKVCELLEQCESAGINLDNYHVALGAGPAELLMKNILIKLSRNTQDCFIPSLSLEGGVYYLQEPQGSCVFGSHCVPVQGMLYIYPQMTEGEAVQVPETFYGKLLPSVYDVSVNTPAVCLSMHEVHRIYDEFIEKLTTFPLSAMADCGMKLSIQIGGGRSVMRNETSCKRTSEIVAAMAYSIGWDKVIMVGKSLILISEEKNFD